jgi:Carbohydrate-selective porin, OprB family
VRFVWQSECFNHIAMQRRIGFCDCTTRPLNRFRGDALRHFWRSTHLYLRRPAYLLSFVLALISVGPLLAQTNSPASDDGGTLFEMRPRQYLFGDWGGKRTALEEKGVKFDFFYIADLEANPTGGLQQTKAGWERIRGTIDINFDELMKWQGLRFHATGLWQVGANLGAKIGTLANPSDLVSAHTTRLDSFWLEQNFLNSKVRVRAGQLAGLDFYGNQEYGGSWLIEPMGYAFGNLFSSIFESFNPAGTPGAEIRFAPKRNFYVKSAVMAANRNPYQQDPTGTNFQIRDTPDFLFETGYLFTQQTARKQRHPWEEASPIPALTNLAACITVANFLTLPGAGAAGTIWSMVWLARPFSGPMPDRIVAWMRHLALTTARVTQHSSGVSDFLLGELLAMRSIPLGTSDLDWRTLCCRSLARGLPTGATPLCRSWARSLEED